MRTRGRNCLSGFLAFALVGFAGTAFASPIPLASADWSAAGDGLVTVDTASSLDWLDITVTAGFSYNYVLGALGTGGQFEGWRYANDVEVKSLLADAGIPEVFGNSNATANTNALSLLRNFFGFVNPATDYYLYFQGLLDGSQNSAVNATRGIVEAFQTDVYGGAPVTDAMVNWQTFGKSDSHWSVGSFLVRDTVVTVVATPEPATLILVSGGLAGLISRRRMKARRDGHRPL